MSSPAGSSAAPDESAAPVTMKSRPYCWRKTPAFSINKSRKASPTLPNPTSASRTRLVTMFSTF